MNYWLAKSEPDSYPWTQLLKEKSTPWDGVRNYQARNNMQKMTVGDLCLFYHTGKEKAVVGIMKVIAEAHQDPTTEDERWQCVDFAPVESLPAPVSLKAIKSNPNLAQVALIRNSRLSVLPLSEEEYLEILVMSAAS